MNVIFFLSVLLMTRLTSMTCTKWKPLVTRTWLYLVYQSETVIITWIRYAAWHSTWFKLHMTSSWLKLLAKFYSFGWEYTQVIDDLSLKCSEEVFSCIMPPYPVLHLFWKLLNLIPKTANSILPLLNFSIYLVHILIFNS